MTSNNQKMLDNDIIEEKTLSDRCCDIFNTVFSSDLSYSTFRYKHYENPYRLSKPLIVETIGNDIAGINGFMAAKFICDSKELYAAQSCDSAVLPQHRGKGVRASIIKKAKIQFETAGIDFLIGLPNKAAYSGLIKLGWKHKVDFCRYFLPLDWYSLLQGRIGKISARITQILLGNLALLRVNRLANLFFEGTISVHESCPFKEEDFAIINNYSKVMIKRSIDYYVWKLDKNPTKEFKYIVARKDGRLCGFFVYHVVNDEVNIIDWCCVQNADELVVMAKLIKQLFSIGTKINIPFINIKSREVSLMRRLGFWNSDNQILRRGRQPLLIDIVNKNYETKLNDPSKWLMRGIDVDTIIS